MATMSLWSIRLLPGTASQLRLEDTVLLTNVALTDQLQEAEGRTSVRITTVNWKSEREDSFVLCSLAPGKAEQCSVHIILHPESTFLFEAIGPNAVYMSGNYIDEFAAVRGIRDVMKQVVIEGFAAARNAEQPRDQPAADGPAVAHLSTDPNANGTRKRRRTSLENSQGASLLEVKGKDAALPEPKVPVPTIQFADSGRPDLGDRTVAVGDDVGLRFKLRDSNLRVVRDNIKGNLLRFKVGDFASGIPQGKSSFHAGVVGMKLKAQRVISVPMEVARTDESLHQYLSPPQPYRLECFVEEFMPQSPQ